MYFIFMTTGIGRAVAIRLHSYGATVYALTRTQETLTSLIAECPGVKPLCVDLRNWEETQAAIASIEAVDSVINIAGIGTEEAFLDITPNIFDE
jgi:NAD(P)-dependent dehydrogenase (short-subunit alcohol dehydrogenase family)